MTKNARLVIVLAIVLAIAGGALFVATRSDGVPAADSVQTNKTTPTPQTETSTDTTVAGQAGKYVDYSTSVIQETTGAKLLFFHAPWCPQCRELDADIKKQGVPAGVTIIKVDYDTNQALRQKYGVTVQTTLVKVDDNGDLVASYVAYDEPSVEAVRNNLLR